ncbi:major capsid protein [Serratia rhizosphaerae]|uniref:major capsid protein n=1 Tax=Serratia rhizosphaerae TaxID=2597702 RepID=UPI002DBE98BF|nr:major capsid protein [Serratia rhizosphaerae]MEB6337663.1 major capsid protein [Serratia rhizosphaerae]
MANHGYEYVSLAPLFEAHPAQNFILQTLGIFDKDSSDTPKVEVDRIVEDNRTLINDNVKRYGSDHNTTQRQEGVGYLVEIPHFARLDQVTTQDFQGKLKLGTDREETLMDITSDYVRRHKIAHARSVEGYYANALFNGKVATPKTSDAPLIDWATTFGTQQKTASIAFSDDSTDVVEAFNGLVDDVSTTAGGLISSLRRYVVFAGAGFYNKLRFHPSMKSYFQYVSPLDAGNIVVQHQELLPGVSTFDLPGLQVTVVKVQDPLLTAYIGTDEAVMVPVFTAETNVYQHIYGPASRDMQLALGATEEFYSYQVRDPRWNNIEIRYEAGLLPVNHVFDLSTRIAAA